MPDEKLELRDFSGCDLRTADSGKKLIGYAATFNRDTDIGWFSESIAPGAFARSLKDRPDVRALFDHDSGRIIGRVQSGNLVVREDSTGLYCEIDPVNTTDGNNVRELVSTRTVDGMSFGFYPKIVQWELRGDKDHRTLIDVELIEVSIVPFPAYDGTSIAARSAEKVWQEHLASMEQEKATQAQQRGLERLAALKRRIAIRERDVRLFG